MLKHFFMGEEGDPTCSCTPNSLTPPPPPPPFSIRTLPCPPHVLELWPLLPQLEHFLAMAAARRRRRRTVEKEEERSNSNSLLCPREMRCL
jgi:hypothetical protein